MKKKKKNGEYGNIERNDELIELMIELIFH